MSHTTQDLQDFIKGELQGVESLEASRRPAARAYLLGVQDAFEFLTTGRTTLGLADRDVDNVFLQSDPNKPLRLPKGVTNTEPANPTVEGLPVEPSQGNDHRGEKAIDHVKHAIQESLPSRGCEPARRNEGLVPDSDEGLRRKR